MMMVNFWKKKNFGNWGGGGVGGGGLEAINFVLSILGCIAYHKRLLCCGSMEMFLHRGSVERLY